MEKETDEKRVNFEKRLQEEVNKLLKELHQPYQETFGKIIINIANSRAVSIEKNLEIKKHQKIDLTSNPYKVEVIKD